MMSSTPTHTPMDIGAVGCKGQGGKPKVKGKGKDKGKGGEGNGGKQLAQPAPQPGPGGQRKKVARHDCRKKGHIRAERRERFKDEGGKSGACVALDGSGRGQLAAATIGAKPSGAQQVGIEWVMALGAEAVDDPRYEGRQRPDILHAITPARGR